MRDINKVLLACFAAALGRTPDTPKLSPAAQRNGKTAIRCMRATTDFCLMAQYGGHMWETIEYMDKYLG